MVIKLKKLNAGYGKLHVLHDVDISIKNSEIISLIGPNGAGKSTVIKAIFNIADVYNGSIIFNGKDICLLKTSDLLKIGISYVPQGKINFGNMTIEENLIIGNDRILTSSALKERLNYVYGKFPFLKTRKKSLAYELSGGQQQMLALGRALMQRPKLLLLDEPSLGLSPKLQKELFNIIQSLKDDGIAILIVEQNAKKAIEISDRTYLLENGRIVLFGGKEILQDKRIKKVYLGGE